MTRSPAKKRQPRPAGHPLATPRPRDRRPASRSGSCWRWVPQGCPVAAAAAARRRRPGSAARRSCRSRAQALRPGSQSALMLQLSPALRAPACRAQRGRLVPKHRRSRCDRRRRWRGRSARTPIASRPGCRAGPRRPRSSSGARLRPAHHRHRHAHRVPGIDRPFQLAVPQRPAWRRAAELHPEGTHQRAGVADRKIDGLGAGDPVLAGRSADRTADRADSAPFHTRTRNWLTFVSSPSLARTVTADEALLFGSTRPAPGSPSAASRQPRRRVEPFRVPQSIERLHVAQPGGGPIQPLVATRNRAAVASTTPPAAAQNHQRSSGFGSLSAAGHGPAGEGHGCARGSGCRASSKARPCGRARERGGRGRRRAAVPDPETTRARASASAGRRPDCRSAGPPGTAPGYRAGLLARALLLLVVGQLALSDCRSQVADSRFQLMIRRRN